MSVECSFGSSAEHGETRDHADHDDDHQNEDGEREGEHQNPNQLEALVLSCERSTILVARLGRGGKNDDGNPDAVSAESETSASVKRTTELANSSAWLDAVGERSEDLGCSHNDARDEAEQSHLAPSFSDIDRLEFVVKLQRTECFLELIVHDAGVDGIVDDRGAGNDHQAGVTSSFFLFDVSHNKIN